MSILNNRIINKSSPEIVANKLIHKTNQTFQIMVDSFNQGSKLFWNNPDKFSPSDIAEVLGSDAKEVFQLHYALGQLILSIKPEVIQEGLSVIGQFTINDDGTVNIPSPISTNTQSPMGTTTAEPANISPSDSDSNNGSQPSTENVAEPTS